MFRISSSIRSTHGQDGAIVLDVAQGQMFNLNLVGSKILELLEKGSDEAQIILAISQEFHADQEVVAPDVRDFLESLKRHKLIVNC